jgi:RHS repeat-associated protein
MAEQNNQVRDRVSCALMTTDQQSSVLNAVTAEQHLRMAYSPYGHHDVVDAMPGLPGFNGEQPDPVTGHYLLGNGYRAYNPVLMRFNSPDSLSPFGEGGLNAYAYCIGDPINSRDPTGHAADRNKILGFVWIGVGFAGAALGLYAAVPAMKAVTKALKSGAPVPTAPMLTAVGATAQVVASTAFTANRIINEVKPGSAALEPLMWVAVGFGVPSLGLRISAQVTTKVAQRAAAAQARAATRKAIKGNMLSPFKVTNGVIKTGQEIRNGLQVTRL